MKAGWHRYHWRQRCPVCLHGGSTRHPSGCAYLGAPESPTLVLCLRVEEGAIKAARDSMGWIHKLREDDRRTRPRPVVQSGIEIDPAMQVLATRYCGMATGGMVGELAESLGVSAESLERLEVGWTGSGWSFPMRAAGNLVVGIRIRGADGRKWSEPNSRNGLFIPKGLPARGPLYIVEGPTDTAAMLTLGLPAIGRPSNTAGRAMLVEYAGRFLPRREVIIVRNNDPEGSTALAQTLAGACGVREDLLARGFVSSVQIVCPPTKDVREWLRSGGRRVDVENLVYSCER